MAVQLGVSCNSICEALRTLGVLGMIEVRHGEGSFMALLFPLVVTQVKRGSYFLFEVLEIYTDA